MNRIKIVAALSLFLLAGCFGHRYGPSPLTKTYPGDFVTYRSGAGAPISVRRHGSGPCRLLILGGIHGDETEAARLVKTIEPKLQAEDELLKRITFFVVTEASPDALACGTRVNASAVDVNRNFPTPGWSAVAAKSRYSPGPRPGSEYETRAVMHMIAKLRPDAILSFHAPLACVNWDGPADALAQSLAAHTGFPLKPGIGYPTPGSLGQYAGVIRKIPIVTFEVGRGEIDAEHLAGKVIRSLDQTGRSCW